MDRRALIIASIGIAVVSFSIGYRQGVQSMVINWQKSVAPTLTNYLAAKDVAEQMMHAIMDDDDED